MKPPTKKELQELAVRALGAGATVEVRRFEWRDGPPWEAVAEATGGAHAEYRDSMSKAKCALAAALRALAEVRK